METIRGLTMNKKLGFLLPCLCMAGAVFAEGEAAAGFDPTTTLASATTTVTTIVSSIGALLAAAIGIYLAFVGYRKAREALNKA